MIAVWAQRGAPGYFQVMVRDGVRAGSEIGYRAAECALSAILV